MNFLTKRLRGNVVDAVAIATTFWHRPVGGIMSVIFDRVRHSGHMMLDRAGD